jgi:hypothetical protein
VSCMDSKGPTCMRSCCCSSIHATESNGPMFLTTRANVRGILSSNNIPESCLEAILLVLPALRRGIRSFCQWLLNYYFQLLYSDCTEWLDCAKGCYPGSFFSTMVPHSLRCNSMPFQGLEITGAEHGNAESRLALCPGTEKC